MKHVRAVTRLLLLTSSTLFLLGLRLLVWPTALISRKQDRHLRRILLRVWAYVFAYICGFKVIQKGPSPKPPFYLVMNHLTYFDMLILARQTGCIFVSRGDVEHWPVFGFIAKSLYIIFIDRTIKRDTMRVNDLIKQTVQEGDGIGVFAESRVTCGMTVEPFKSPLLQAAIDLDMPVHYATLSYRTPEGSPTEGQIVSWWRNEPFYVHLYRFLQHSGATATITFGEEPIHDSDRKSLAKRLHEGVLANFTPLRLAITDYADPSFPLEIPEYPGDDEQEQMKRQQLQEEPND